MSEPISNIELSKRILEALYEMGNKSEICPSCKTESYVPDTLHDQWACLECDTTRPSTGVAGAYTVEDLKEMGVWDMLSEDSRRMFSPITESKVTWDDDDDDDDVDYIIGEEDRLPKGTCRVCGGTGMIPGPFGEKECPACAVDDEEETDLSFDGDDDEIMPEDVKQEEIEMELEKTPEVEEDIEEFELEEDGPDSGDVIVDENGDDMKTWNEDELEEELQEAEMTLSLEDILAIEDPIERFRMLGYDVHEVLFDPGNVSITFPFEVPDGADKEVKEYMSERKERLTDTGRRFITKRQDDGTERFIADVSYRYAMFPNEVMADIGDELAKKVGAKIHQDCSNDKRLYRYYIKDKPCGPTGAKGYEEGELLPGFLVMNSIDGSMGAGVEPFLYRVVCKNGMMVQMKTAMTLKARHTGAIHDIERRDFLSMCKTALELSEAIAEKLKEWVSIDLSVKNPLTDQIIQNLQYCGIPNAYKDEVPFLWAPNKRLDEKDIPAVPKGMDLWEAYNHITAALTRPPNGKVVSERTRVDYQHMLHKALAPELGAIQMEE